MSLRFTVLASGSSGNAVLVETDRGGILIDAGLGSRQLAGRFAAVGASWASVDMVLLTHTHSDHWSESALTQLFQRRIALCCHADHHRWLSMYSRNYPLLNSAGLLREYRAGQEFEPVPGLRCRPLPIRHDGGETFGFRLEAGTDLFGQTVAIGYAADLGSWDDALAEALANVDLLALEFNHDVHLECQSGRSAALIARVLGDEGHLSNEQAAQLLCAALRRSSPNRLRHLVQLHLSRECNRRSLAVDAARTALKVAGSAAEVHTAEQYRGMPAIHLGASLQPRQVRRAAIRNRARSAVDGSWLPGLECE